MLYGLLYQLFRPAHAALVRVALLFGMTSLTIEAVALLHLYVPAVVTRQSSTLAGFNDPQR